VDESGEVAGLDEDDTLGSVDLIHEFAGASLFGAATVYAVSLVLHGPGNDGKSTILNVLRSLFPPSSVCSIAPQDWTRGFLLAGLAGKLLNVVNELPEREMMEGARFKAVTSGDPLTAERKFGDPFTMRVVAGELFAANDLFPTRGLVLVLNQLIRTPVHTAVSPSVPSEVRGSRVDRVELRHKFRSLAETFPFGSECIDRFTAPITCEPDGDLAFRRVLPGLGAHALFPRQSQDFGESVLRNFRGLLKGHDR
jgi:hypothetical protein